MKGSVFVGAGILSIAIGIIFIIIRGDYKKIPNSQITKGNICSLEYEAGSNHSGGYYAHIQYFVNGKEFYIKTRTKARVGFYIGKKMFVKYNKENPAEAMHIGGFCDYLLGPGIFIIFGIYIILSEGLGILPQIFN